MLEVDKMVYVDGCIVNRVDIRCRDTCLSTSYDQVKMMRIEVWSLTLELLKAVGCTLQSREGYQGR